MQPTWHPFTPVSLAAAGVISVLVANNFWISLGVFALCACIGVWGKAHKAFGAGLLIAAPAYLGFFLMYAPFSENGWQIAGELGTRFLAATTVGLVFLSFVDIDAFMRAVQPRLPATLVYVIGSASRLYPLAQYRLRTIREVRLTRGLPIRGLKANLAILMPLVVGLVDDAGQRARPLTRMGLGNPGPRTVLNPVTHRTQDTLVQLFALGAVVVVTIASIGGWL
ncbi:MAG: energy-coupling factor transporter transmembrane component T [Corynebacterium sp.]|nr:energy-coupling factor transporter transmembrane component T [Corynebacterium sp.]